MNIGENIKRLRQENNMTQEELAKLLCVSMQSVSRWENKLNYPDIILLPKISKIFNVSVDYLLGIKDERNINNEKQEKFFIDLQKLINDYLNN